MKTTLKGIISKVRTNEIVKSKDIRVSRFIITNGTTQHNIVAWQNQNMPNLNKLKDGDMVSIVGVINSQIYDNLQGIPTPYSEIIANEISII